MLDRAVEMMESGKITAEKYVDHVYPLEKVNEAFEMAMNSYDSMKVMLEP
jgi:threonine dehydrogenase-like Zn-dependent dehydrogenase